MECCCVKTFVKETVSLFVVFSLVYYTTQNLDETIRADSYYNTVNRMLMLIIVSLLSREKNTCTTVLSCTPAYNCSRTTNE